MNKENKTYALDTESYYNSETSITTMGPWKYTRASACYLVTIVGSDGYEFAGHPKDVDWGLLRGATIIMANAGYDLTVLEAEAERGTIPADLGFGSVYDVLDMSRYMGRPGSLKGAVESLLGKLAEESGGISKQTRNNMKGKKWGAMSDKFKAEVVKYALDDARWTLRLWEHFNDQWPWYERELSRQTREMCMKGLPIDVEKAKGYATHLKGLIFNAEKKIPWANKEGAKILSPKALAEECRKVGIVPPKSLAKDSEECAAWENKYGEEYPWVGAMRDWRRCNMLLKKVETFITRTKPDGWMPFGMKYFGAGSTGRFSGDSGLNVQNLNREEMFGVNLRSLIKAPPGFKVASVDLSAIEPRVMNWVVGDQAALDSLAAGADVYEAHARATLGYTDPRPLKDVDSELRRLAKARCLAGTTPILTEKGYFTVAELISMPCVRVWDGVEWVDYEKVIVSGSRKVVKLLGEHFTSDHEIFTKGGTEQVGEILRGAARGSQEELLRRNPPSGGWADVWALAGFVGRSLIREWVSSHKGALHVMWERFRNRLGQHKKEKVNTMRVMRESLSDSHTAHSFMGEGSRRNRPVDRSAVGHNDAKVL